VGRGGFGFSAKSVSFGAKIAQQRPSGKRAESGAFAAVR
jgi:hypothetical protein